jgi:Protein of unknown function (DUF1573)
MKRLVFIFGAALLIVACKEADKKTIPAAVTDSAAKTAGIANQSASISSMDSSNFTTIEWIDNINQTLPKIKEGEVIEITYRFKNTGNKPLVVEGVSASCGCTVPEKPEEPIMPGKEGLIKAKFDSHGKPGPNTKSLTVVANTSSEKLLTFYVEVVK